MREAVADIGAQPLRNLAYFPKWEIDPPSGGTAGSFGTLGGTQGTTTTSYVINDLVFPGVGRTRVNTVTVEGNWGRRWSYNEPLTPGQRVRSYFWIKVSAAATITPSHEWSAADGSYVSGMSSAAVSLAANTWTRIDQSSIVPLIANGKVPAFLRTVGFTSAAVGAVGFEFRLGPTMVVMESALPAFYFDGDSPGWRWTGTAGNSQSVGYIPEARGMVVNLAKNPRAGITSGGFVGSNVNSIMPTLVRGVETGNPEGTFVRATWGGTQSTVGGGMYAGSTTVRSIPVEAGRVYSLIGSVRPSVAQVMAARVDWHTSAGAFISSSVGTDTSCPANAWTDLPLAGITAPANADRALLVFYVRAGGTAWASGNTLDLTKVMFTATTTIRPYGDGDVFGWRWTGAAHDSASYGEVNGFRAIPADLVAIAGAPLFFTENPAAAVTIRYFTPLTPFTIVSSHRFPATTNVPGGWEITNSRRFVVANANTLMVGRRYVVAAGWEGSAQVSGITPTNWITSVSRLDTQSASLMLDGGTVANSGTNTDIAELGRDGNTNFRIGSRDVTVQAEAPTTRGLAIYPGLLTDVQARQVTAWFARRYGTPVPAGY